MSTYGRRFWFLTPPEPNERRGRYVVGDDPIVIGAPVEAEATIDANGQRELTLRTTAVAPVQGKHGILIYENPFATAPGLDPVQQAIGDFEKAPVDAPAQLVSGVGIKFRLKNVAAEVIQGQKTYPALAMVGGLGATPTLAVDNYIGPGVGNDTDGYWQEADLAHAWAVVTCVYDTGEIDAELVF